MTEHPDEDALVTTLDGVQVDVVPDVQQETVTLTSDSGTSLVLTASGASELAEQLVSAVRVVRGELR